MLKIGKKTSDPQTAEDMSVPKKTGNGNWFGKNQHIVAIGVIVLIAFLIRFIDAAGLCMGNNYALSGGTGASEHLHRITNMLTGGAIFGLDGALYYPFGSADANPPLMDLILGVFAFIFKACGLGTTAAAGASLAWGAVIFGTLAVIPAYILGKEIFDRKAAGYLTAIFVALCPIAISQTVFSNGTEIGFVMFFALFMFCFLFKGIKAIDAGEPSNKYMILTAVFMAIVSFSWIGARSLYTVLILMMAVQLIIDRFKGKELMPTAIYYSVPVIVGAVVAAAYYAVAGLFVSVYLGTFLMAVIGVVLCVAFAALKDTPWTLTIPGFVIVTVVLFVALFLAVPDLYNSIVGRITEYSGIYASFTSSSIGFSMVATYFGFVTMWFGLCMVLYRIYALPKNMDSRMYVAVLVWMIVGMLFAITTRANAAVLSCTFGIGFAAVILWICSRIDFKAYWLSIKTAGFKGMWKKIIKPVPFLAVIGAVVLILLPNCMYALDAGVSNNNASNPAYQGSVNYYIMADKDYTYNEFFSKYSDIENKGALVSWLDYSSDAATFGNFNVITDNRGNGTTAMANIMLSNGSDGSAVAVMLYYLVTYAGVDSCKTVLGDNYEKIKDITENPGNYRDEVVKNSDKYGIVSSDISNDNISYLAAVEYLTDNNTSFEISEMYDALAAQCGKNVTYIMASGELIPISYGNENTFIELAVLNGYAYKVVTETNYSYVSVPEFYSAGSLFTSYGIYDYTDSLTNTFLWRAYIGMSPEEAGITGSYASISYISALSRSDGTYKAVPGYGLANFEVDYDTYYVSYNAEDDGTGTWEKMLYNEAIALQEKEGGLINYLAGYPIMLKYISSNSEKVSGTVSIAGENVSGVRVAAVDSDGVQRYTTFTDADGKYTIILPTRNFEVGSGCKIVFSVGTTSVTGGTQVWSKEYDSTVAETKTCDVTVSTVTSLSGKIVTDNVDVDEYLIEMVGQASGKLYNATVTGDAFSFASVVPDTYDITVKSLDGKITYATKTYLTAIGANSGLSISLDESKITLTVKDEAGNLIKDVTVGIKSGTTVFKGVTDSKGVATFYASAGTYTYVVFSDGYTTNDSSTLEVTKSTAKSGSFSVMTAKKVNVTGAASGTVYGMSYTGAVEDSAAKIPVGLTGSASYTIYSVDKIGEGAKVSWAVTDGSADVTLKTETGFVITGKLKSGDDAVTGKIMFIKNTGEIVSVYADADNGYTAVLPAGEYTAYAVSSSMVAMENVTVSASETKDISVASGKTISGKVYWYSSSYALKYATVKVDVTVDDEKTTYTLATDADGKYSMVIPSDAKYKVTSVLNENGPFYYKVDDNKVYSKSLGDDESGDFTASVEKITIKNANEFTITVEGKEIEKGAELEFDYKPSSYSVSAAYSTGYYYSGSVYILPTQMSADFKYDMKVDATEYVKAVFSNVSSDYIITVTADDEGEYHKESQADNKAEYYFEKGESFLVKITDADKKKVAYYSIDGTATYASTAIDVTLTDAVNVKGYVGIGADGTITFNEDKKLEFEVESGRYDVVIPFADSYTIAVDVTDDDSHVYNLTKTDVKLTAGDNVYNMAVIGGELKEETKDASVKLTLTDMEDVTDKQRVKIKFTAEVDYAAAEEGSTAVTYLLSGGSDWFNVTFYSDEARTQQITSVNGKTTVYGEGMIKVGSVASCSEDLSVILSDLSGEEVCTGVFEDETGWKKTTPDKETTKVAHGKDKTNEAEYMYSIDVVNDDNFKKSFKIKLLDTFDADKYVVTYLYGNKVVAAADATGALDVPMTVDGYSTLTVYVKITLINGESSEIADKKINTQIVFDDVSEITADGDSITVDGSKVTVVSSHLDSVASVSLSAEGRGIVSERSSMPSYVWVLTAVILVMLILIIWLGIRRGVFTRRK